MVTRGVGVTEAKAIVGNEKNRQTCRTARTYDEGLLSRCEATEGNRRHDL